jgi:ABC-type branched-subunit amino acid transport system substrate-binding protein
MKKTVLVNMVIAMAVLIMAGCSKTKKIETPGVTDTQILIGTSCPLGGYASFLGTQYSHGSETFINDINDKGGIHGRRIKLIVYDDQYDPAKCVANTQKLIGEDRVFMLFDYVGTPTSVKIIDIVNKAEVPTFGFFTGAEVLRTPFRPYMFHVRDSYYGEAEGAMGYFIDKLGLRKIAVMYQEDAFGLAVLEGVQLALKRRNMETVVTATFPRETTNVEKSLKIIKASGADVVVMVGTYTPLARFVNISHKVGFTPYFYTVSFVGSEAYGKELVEGHKVAPSQYNRIIVTQVVPSPFDDSFPTVRHYRELITKYFPQDQPNYVALEGFVNALVLSKILEACGKKLTREKFVTALESIHNMDIGIGMPVTYGPMNHRGLGGIYYSRLTKDGTFRIFKP